MPRNDLGLYDRHAREWWDARSRFARSLHEVNRVRLELVRARWGARLRGARVADLGCGGGLLAEPLARDGAAVIGVDLSGPTLAEARRHAAGVAASAVSYARGDARRPPLAAGWADLVLCADVLEHVADWRAVLAGAGALLAPGGEIFFTTINRTRRAGWLAVTLGEGLGLVPRGTHDPRLFITPAELATAAAGLGLRCDAPLGLRPRLLATALGLRLRMRTCRSLAVEYAGWLITSGEDIDR
jgi:2-polyprenyl-6-hydroxyphenyl methylase/3-demethylubiquinone-9 3-methyltransferase